MSAPVYHPYRPILVNESFRPADFAAPFGLKDMRLASEAAEKSVARTSLSSLLRNRLLKTIARKGRTSTGRRSAGPAPGTPVFAGSLALAGRREVGFPRAGAENIIAV